MAIKKDYSNDFARTKGQVRIVSREGIEVNEVPKDITIPSNIDLKLLEEIVHKIIGAFKGDLPQTIYSFDLPFINSGGASLGAKLSLGFHNSKEAFLLVERVDDVSANTTAIQPINIPLKSEITPEIVDELREVILSLIKEGGYQLADRANLRTGYNEFAAKQNLQNKNDLNN